MLVKCKNGDSKEALCKDKCETPSKVLQFLRQVKECFDGTYEEEYTCWPPAICMIIISLVEIVLFCYDAAHGSTRAGGPMAKIFIYDPHKRHEAWRFLTYMFVHVGVVHLLVNLLVQLFLGVPLEMVHRWWRVSLVYLAGVAAGSLATSLTDPHVYLAGASGGVYALIAAHIATIIMNWSEMEFAIIQLLVFVLLAAVDVGTAVYDRYWGAGVQNIGYVAHLAGAVAGECSALTGLARDCVGLAVTWVRHAEHWLRRPPGGSGRCDVGNAEHWLTSPTWRERSLVLVQEINQNALLDIISKYHEDICDGDSDRKLLCSEDIEAFIKFNYPDLGLSREPTAEEDFQEWECRDHLCQKVYQGHEHMHFFKSLSRCTLLCIGPLLWPWPIGYTSFSNTITAFAKSRTDYKFKEVMSVVVHQYLAEAFKLFLADLERLERIDLHSSNKNRTQDLEPLQLVIEMHVNKDADPRIRLDTDEAYTLKIATTESQLKVEIQSASFAGIRHGLETLSQLIYLDQATGHLITLSQVVIKDAPTYKYRGLMIDTGRNYIPVPDLMRTIDAMSSVKFNTFHWRISDSTSFPWLLPDYPELFEYGAYDRSLIYTTEDVRTIVSRAGIRGIRVLLEVSAPGPVGRAWSWTTASACQQTRKNTTQCDKELCRRLKMKRSAFDILENIYFTILQLTKVDDIFHMSDSVFSFIECYYIVDSREGFLSQALDRLRVANKGLLPALPIIWYTEHLTKTLEAEPWHGLGVQLNEWQNNPVGDFLTHYKLILTRTCGHERQR
ncbi:hypothetical protein MSG28_005581 [Choristoneura fumiferana]|uniref:Uncharacterized protein n=1 Tax=Choristoneura fumiferana TaxID=7141 RepID=A0ACC0KZF0_CHOFU|nr:hypothetical protein MSG28_005581 [Choristoneura fumiferana]